MGWVVGIVLPISGAASTVLVCPLASCEHSCIHWQGYRRGVRTHPSAFPLPSLFSSDLASSVCPTSPMLPVGGEVQRLGQV